LQKGRASKEKNYPKDLAGIVFQQPGRLIFTTYLLQSIGRLPLLRGGRRGTSSEAFEKRGDFSTFIGLMKGKGGNNVHSVPASWMFSGVRKARKLASNQYLGP